MHFYEKSTTRNISFSVGQKPTLLSRQSQV